MPGLKLYKSYNFVDKDPVIDRVRNIISKEGLSNSEAALKSGVAPSTLYNWFEGNTKRPQYATVMAVVRALGYKEMFVRKGDKDAARGVSTDTGNKVLRLRRQA
jgi:predicted transcriptional regulator